MINSQENILSTSIKAQHIQISLKIAKTSSHLVTLQDNDGVRPLDVASAYGLVDVVRELMVLGGPEVSRLAGKDGKTAIHHGIINGRVDVVEELMVKCPDCIKDVTSFGETVLHLAVKYYKFDVLKSLLQWLEKLGSIAEVVNLKDKQGNTVLHYAVARKQLEGVEILLDCCSSSSSNNMDGYRLQLVNAQNSIHGLTPMDILNIMIMESSSDLLLIKELLRQAGGGGGVNSTTTTTTTIPSVIVDVVDNNVAPPPVQPNEMPTNFEELLTYFHFDWRPAKCEAGC